MTPTFWQPPKGLAVASEQITDLAIPRDLRFETSQRLIDLVSKHQKGGKTLTQFAPSGVSSGISDLKAAPLDLLHMLGVASTPQVPNPVSLSHLWALLRYLWAFRPAGGGSALALDAATLHVRHHQRTLLSEQLAIGVAAWFIEKVVCLPSPHCVDVDFAIYDPAWLTLLNWAGDKLPDYIYFSSASPEAMPADLHLVECKGTREKLPHHAKASTHKTKYRLLEQFSRAAKQLEGVAFENMSVVRVAFGTTLDDDSVCLYALDPPADDDVESRTSHTRGRKTVPMKGGARVIDERLLLEDLQSLRDSKLLTFAGAYEDAIAAMPAAYRDQAEPRRSRPAADLGQWELEGIGYRGSRLRLELHDGSGIEMKLGLQEDVFEACRDHDSKRLEGALAALRASIGSLRTVASKDGQSLVSQSAAGTMLQLGPIGADA